MSDYNTCFKHSWLDSRRTMTASLTYEKANVVEHAAVSCWLSPYKRIN